MVELSDEPSLSDRNRSHSNASPRSDGALDRHPAEPISKSRKKKASPRHYAGSSVIHDDQSNDGRPIDASSSPTRNDTADQIVEAHPPPAPPPLENVHGKEPAAIENGHDEDKPNIFTRFFRVCKEILFSSWMNVLLVFVPVGIAVRVTHVNPNIVFALNAIAIVPLAGLLSHATESVASEMGDTVGSLMNVTFGNAVELIIFIIALTKNEIRIVQASLLGSILANLLLILGMCFLFGGLRFREQIYNSVVTQMSACLLSLSVMSLLLPTAFHASFVDNAAADRAVLQVSRGTSVILLLVYVLYLLFQLKSHAYMYQSTPQHVIDEESHPGVLHDIMNSSSSSDDSSSSSGSDTDGSSGSVTTAKRIRRVLRRRKRRKSSFSSKDTPSGPSTLRTPSTHLMHVGDDNENAVNDSDEEKSGLQMLVSGDEADGEHDSEPKRRLTRDSTTAHRDFENEKNPPLDRISPGDKRKGRSRKKHHRNSDSENTKEDNASEKASHPEVASRLKPPGPRVGFVQDFHERPSSSPRRSFNLRNLTVRDVVPVIPPIPKVLTSTVFSSTNPTGLPPGPPSTSDGAPHTLQRSTSLPSRLNQVQAARRPTPVQSSPFVRPIDATHANTTEDGAKPEKNMSRTAAVILLLISTGLVAVCADFLVDSINYLVNDTSISEAFVGLIILPIVGNAAEHVTAVTVAAKNKMDLAIGVAVGSSIQIALFVTPVIVLLGWILKKEMSLYFSLFETISLFVSAFIVNFLVLDGRSNYLEGALLIAAYVIIAVAAFFYPDQDEQSGVGGGGNADGKMMLKRMVVDVIDHVSKVVLSPVFTS